MTLDPDQMRVDPCARVTCSSHLLESLRMAIMTRSRARKVQVAARVDARAARAARRAAARVAAEASAARLAAEPDTEPEDEPEADIRLTFLPNPPFSPIPPNVSRYSFLRPPIA